MGYPKELQIIRQSQIKVVVDYTRDLGVVLTIRELNKVVDVFCEAVAAPIEGEILDKMEKTDKWLAKKAKEQKEQRENSNVITG